MGKEGRRWKAGLTVVILVVGIAMLFLIAQPLSAASQRAMPPAGTGLAAVVTPSGISSTGAITAKTTTCATGTNPEYVAFDPVNNYFYVSNVGGASISVYKKTCTLVTTITLTSDAYPRAIVFDPSNNYMYVTEEGANAVLAISGTTIVQTITSGLLDAPWGITYDPAGGYYNGSSSLVVTNVGNNTIAYIGTSNPSTGAASVYVAEPALGDGPISILYVPFDNALMVVNQLSDNVTAFDATYGTVLSHNIPVGSEPQGIAYSAATDQVYVANRGSNNVSIIDAFGLEFGSIKVGKDPITVGFDQTTLQMFVLNFGGNTISLVGLSDTVVKTLRPGSGSEPAGLAYNSASGKMDVVGWGSDLVYVES